jgi:hypothetical protein
LVLKARWHHPRGHLLDKAGIPCKIPSEGRGGGKKDVTKISHQRRKKNDYEYGLRRMKT